MVQTAIAFWLWTGALVSVLAGETGMFLVLLVDLLMAWWLRLTPASIGIIGCVGLGALGSSFLLGRRFRWGRDPVAAAGFALFLGLVLRPVLGLLGVGVLPALSLARRSSCGSMLPALLPPLIRVAASLFMGAWLLIKAGTG